MSSQAPPLESSEVAAGPNLAVARAYIHALTGSADTPMTFQTFDDTQMARGDLTRVLHGTIDQLGAALWAANQRRAGVFVTVNETDLLGRKSENVVGLRALFVDTDDGSRLWRLEPSLTVDSANGPHAYWLLKPGECLEDFPRAQEHLAAFHGTDPAVKDLPRVMRLPGFDHHKEDPFRVTFRSGTGQSFTIAEILAAHPLPEGTVVRRPAIAFGPDDEQILDGQGHATLLRIAGKMRRDGLAPEEILAALRAVNTRRMKRDPMPDADVALIASSSATWPPSEPLGGPEQAGAGGLQTPPHTAGFANVRLLSDVKPERIGWLWKPRIPRRLLTMFDGDPGRAKSTILLELAARLSRGREWPDGTMPDSPGKTLILSAEDPAETILRPRFDEMGGDPAMVLLLDSVKRPREDSPDLFSLASDIPILEGVAETFRPDLIIIDPITAFLGVVNSWKDQEIRRALGPLARLGERIDAAIVLIRHLNKNSSVSELLYRGGGSIGFIAAARSGLVSMLDPDEEQEEGEDSDDGGDEQTRKHLFAHYKCNAAKKAPTLAYRIVSSQRDPDLPVIEWLGADPRSADSINAAGAGTPDERSARGSARGFLRQLLFDAEGRQAETDEILKEGKRQGHSVKTLRRAKQDLKIQTRKVGFRPSVWFWRLP